ncbi:MAG: hypothetical protein V2J62_06940 [candidate division KSB1 bacterium]|jgi:hypothetical protein|nr:hypothetical protein [candidate division KSB1 bacterium]
MMSEQTMERKLNGNNGKELLSNADEISVETIANLLVKKGIVSTEELFMLEGRVREEKTRLENANYVNVKNSHIRGSYSGFKKLMSQYRWTRRLGTFLFGWKWKKVKKS